MSAELVLWFERLEPEGGRMDAMDGRLEQLKVDEVAPMELRNAEFVTGRVYRMRPEVFDFPPAAGIMSLTFAMMFVVLYLVLVLNIVDVTGFLLKLGLGSIFLLGTGVASYVAHKNGSRLSPIYVFAKANALSFLRFAKLSNLQGSLFRDSSKERFVHNVIGGIYRGHSFRMFEYSTIERAMHSDERMQGFVTGSNRTQYAYTVLEIEMPSVTTSFFLNRKRTGDPFFSSGRIQWKFLETESNEFSKRYEIYVREQSDERDVLQILAPDVIQRILDWEKSDDNSLRFFPDVELVGGAMYLYSSGSVLKDSDVLAMFSAANVILE